MSVNDFDEQDALERTAGDWELLREVLRFTLSDLPPMLEEVEGALSAGDFGEASRIAQKVKGVAGAAGAQSLYLLALDMEIAGGEGEEKCLELLSPLNQAFNRFRSHPRVIELASLDDEDEVSIG